MENNTNNKVSNYAFRIQNLSFSYGNKRILDHISFVIPQGKITTLIGPNGCGKSTLFQLLTNNLTPDKGSIYFHGKSIQNYSLRDYAREVAIVHQSNYAPDDLTIEQLVSYGRIPFSKFGRVSLSDIDSKYIDRALKATGLEPIRHRQLKSLSGGQRQRCFIAMALAQGTKTILLDEPTTYLDIRYQLQILKLVQFLNTHLGYTIVMVLHEINQAIHYSDVIIGLSQNGTIAVNGKPEQVISSNSLEKIYDIPLDIIPMKGQPFVLTV